MYPPQSQKQRKKLVKEQREFNKVFLDGLVPRTTATHVIKSFAKYGLTVVGMQQIMESNESSHYWPTVQFMNKQHKMKALKLGKIKINDAICQIRQYRQMPPSDIDDQARVVNGSRHPLLVAPPQAKHHPLLVAPPQQAKHRRLPPPPGIKLKQALNARLNYSTTKPKPLQNPPHYPKETKIIPKPIEQYGSMRELLKEFYFLSTICHELDDEMQNIILKKKDIIKKQCFIMEQLQKRQIYMHEETFRPHHGFEPNEMRIPPQMRRKRDPEQKNLDMKTRTPAGLFPNQQNSTSFVDVVQNINQPSGMNGGIENVTMRQYHMCRYFLENRCVHGNNCQFSHDKTKVKYNKKQDFIENQLEESDSESIDFKDHLENQRNAPSKDVSRDQVVVNRPEPNNLKKTQVQYSSENLLSMRKRNPDWYNVSENLPAWAPLKDENTSSYRFLKQ